MRVLISIAQRCPGASDDDTGEVEKLASGVKGLGDGKISGQECGGELAFWELDAGLQAPAVMRFVSYIARARDQLVCFRSSPMHRAPRQL